MDTSIEQKERLVLGQVKFLNFILQEIRSHNKILREELGQSYAKLIGLGTPYEAAINVLREVKTEFDTYLSILRAEMLKDDFSQKQTGSRRKKRKFFPDIPSKI